MEAVRSVVIASVEKINVESNVSPEEYAKSVREMMMELGMNDCYVSVIDAPIAYGYVASKGE